MESKLIGVREDNESYMMALATKVSALDHPNLAAAGFQEKPSVILHVLGGNVAIHDKNDWAPGSMLLKAHDYIEKNWDSIDTHYAIIDTRMITSENPEPIEISSPIDGSESSAA